MSIPGIGNATTGSLLADGLKSVFTPLDKKVATKGDLKDLSNKLIKRYHAVNNIPARNDGALPYFDLETNTIIFSFFTL